MKRTLIIVAMVMIMFGTFKMNAQAAVRDNAARAKAEQNIKEMFDFAEKEFEDRKADGEIRLIESVEFAYDEVGMNIYDIHMEVTLHDGMSFVYHFFYDAVEDEDLTDYIEIDGERLSYDEFEEIYPELADEID